MVKIAVVVVALLGACGNKSNPCEQKGGDGKACLKYADEQQGKAKVSELEYWYEYNACNNGAPEGCTKAADLYAMEKNYGKSGDLYMRGCQRDQPKACLALGIAFRDGVGAEKDAETARIMFKKGCDLKEDAACKALAALPADKAATPPAVDAGAPAAVPGDDKMTDLAFCDFIVKQLCTRCASAHSMTEEACVKSQSADACAGLTGKMVLSTPADFRARCAGGIAKIDCNRQNGGIPEECTPPTDAPAPGDTRASWDRLGDESDSVELCTYITAKLCTRCADGAAQMDCFQSRGHSACAPLATRTGHLATPQAFRTKCAAALDAMDCKAKDAAAPADCIPPK